MAAWFDEANAAGSKNLIPRNAYCVGCHKKHLPSDLWLSHRRPRGGFVGRPFQQGAGRGVHLCYNHKCIELAHRSRAIERSLKRAELPWSVEQVCDQIVAALDEKLRGQPRFAQLANGLVSGMDSIERHRHQVAGFVLAVDAWKTAKSSRKMGAVVWHRMLTTLNTEELVKVLVSFTELP